MDFLDAVDVYFTGERSLGYALIPLGLGLLGFGVYLWRGYGGGLGTGMGVPLMIVGLAAGIGGAGLAWQVNQRGAELRAQYEQDARAPVDKELSRMDKVNANWKPLKLAWTGLIVVCLALLAFVHRDWVTGLALALILLGACLLVLDTFAERRALLYTERIAPLAQPAQPAQPD